jgi:hypothetical protein
VVLVVGVGAVGAPPPEEEEEEEEEECLSANIDKTAYILHTIQYR